MSITDESDRTNELSGVKKDLLSFLKTSMTSMTSSLENLIMFTMSAKVEGCLTNAFVLLKFISVLNNFSQTIF